MIYSSKFAFLYKFRSKIYLKIKNKKVTKNKRAGSKFLEKYNDRIVSIRESETKIKEKAKKQSTAKKK